MIYDFVISLKNPVGRSINTISFLMVFLFLLVFGFQALQNNLIVNYRVGIIFPLVIIGLLGYGFLNRRKPGFQIHYRWELAVVGVALVYLPLVPNHVLAGWLYLLLSVAERYVKRPVEFYFSNQDVVRQGIFRKTYQWVQIRNVVLRDNLFTLDFSNNKLIQIELDAPTDAGTEAEFNQFCRKRLEEVVNS